MGRVRKRERNISTTTTSGSGYYYFYYRGTTTAATGVLSYSNMWKNNMCFQTELNYFRSSTTTTTTTVMNYYHHYQSGSTTITISSSICMEPHYSSVPVKTLSTISRLNQVFEACNEHCL